VEAKARKSPQLENANLSVLKVRGTGHARKLKASCPQGILCTEMIFEAVERLPPPAKIHSLKELGCQWK